MLLLNTMFFAPSAGSDTAAQQHLFAKASCRRLWAQGSAQLLSQGMAAGVSAVITDIVLTPSGRNKKTQNQKTSNPESTNLVKKSQEIIITAF